MTATAKSGGSRKSNQRNHYKVYEILVYIGEEATIDEIIREYRIRWNEELNRNTARARKSDFKKEHVDEYEQVRKKLLEVLEECRKEDAERKQRLARLRKLLMLFVGAALVGVVIVKLCA